LWIGIGRGEAELVALSRRLNDGLHRLGWPLDDRPLQAHLTLARTDGVQGADEKAERLIERARDLRLDWQADSLVLYKSNLGHGPTHYEVVSEAALS
jgi:2'-5' RNA ligase